MACARCHGRAVVCARVLDECLREVSWQGEIGLAGQQLEAGAELRRVATRRSLSHRASAGAWKVTTRSHVRQRVLEVQRAATLARLMVPTTTCPSPRRSENGSDARDRLLGGRGTSRFETVTGTRGLRSRREAPSSASNGTVRFPPERSANTSTGSDQALRRYWLCSFDYMAKNKTNQERARKYGGSSSFVDVGQPSRAPRQDEEGQKSIVSASREVGPADGNSTQQGISNRPAKDEHAFPDPDESDSQAVPESEDHGPKQVGGNRGQV